MSIFSKKLYDINMRNHRKDAIILTVKPHGESNRLVTFLTADEGICTSILYGGPKSKLRAKISPWNMGTIYLYNDEVKHSSKITDFDVKNYHLSFRESLFKMWAANLTTEVVIQSKSAGSPKECFYLLNGFFDGLDIIDENQGQMGLLRFLWRYLNLLGILPNNYSCLKCQSSFITRKNDENTIEYKIGGAIYSQSEYGFICQNCLKEYSTKFDRQLYHTLSSKSIIYLEQTIYAEPSITRNMILSTDEINNLKRFIFQMIEQALGNKIKTLHTGIGIL